ncbi:MAG: ABC transporter ATP-binding protein [Bacteroidales bacterium]|jgi:lipoprotein-releasing system ATP-binding protein|nr:ABC transporter ATP-binding protein [Bacteroidales bacterium]MCR5115690.1 ABC transporter ATP-binding protein [Bacteroidales bacterium]
MIEVKSLNKSYGTLQVLKEINLRVEDSAVVSIVGASGAGKSTLLHLIGTLDRPDSGQVLIDGTDIFALNDTDQAAYRNRNIGFVFQFHHLLPEFTAAENVALPAMIAGQSHADALKRAHELLDFLNLGDRLNHKPSQLSGGEQQRVAVARALANNPKIVLADEPSGNLDTQNARKLHQLFFDLRDQFHQTFVVVTHNPELATLADKTFEIKDGRL